MPARDQLPVIALVTAYNEEVTVGGVLDALLATPSIDHVQLVDDGSTDQTTAIARERPVRLIRLPERVPVGQAIMHHLTELEEEVILLWCDADLVNLRPEYLETLIQRFRDENVCQSLSSRGLPRRWPRWFRGGPSRFLWTRFFGPLSGERVMLKSVFEDAIGLAHRLSWQEMMRGYGIVLFLNWYCSAYGSGSVITYFDELRQRQKYEKWGWASGWEMLRQWIQFGVTWLKIRCQSPRIRSFHS